MSVIDKMGVGNHWHDFYDYAYFTYIELVSVIIGLGVLLFLLKSSITNLILVPRWQRLSKYGCDVSEPNQNHENDNHKHKYSTSTNDSMITTTQSNNLTNFSSNCVKNTANISNTTNTITTKTKNSINLANASSTDSSDHDHYNHSDDVEWNESKTSNFKSNNIHVPSKLPKTNKMEHTYSNSSCKMNVNRDSDAGMNSKYSNDSGQDDNGIQHVQSIVRHHSKSTSKQLKLDKINRRLNEITERKLLQISQISWYNKTLLISSIICSLLQEIMYISFITTIVFFNVRNVSCGTRSTIMIPYVLQRLFLYSFFILRLYFSFENSIYSLHKYTTYAFFVYTVIGLFTGLTSFIYVGFTTHDDTGLACDSKIMDDLRMILFSVDITTNAFLAGLFIYKLKQVRYRNYRLCGFYVLYWGFLM